MKNFLLILLSLTIFSACTPGGMTPAATIKGENDTVLELPEGALPDGISPEDVKLEPITNGVAITPDGVILETEAKLELNLKDFGFPIFAYEEDCDPKSCEPTRIIEDVKIDISGEGNKAEIPVKEFGRIIATTGSESMFDAYAEAGDTVVGGTVSGKAVITIKKPSYTFVYSDGGEGVYEIVQGTQAIQGSITGTNTTPGFVAGRPPKSQFVDQYTIQTSDFKCVAEGPGSLNFEVFLTWRDKRTSIGGAIMDAVFGDNPGMIRFNINAPFMCKKKENGFQMINPPSLYLDAGTSR